MWDTEEKPWDCLGNQQIVYTVALWARPQCAEASAITSSGVRVPRHS